MHRIVVVVCLAALLAAGCAEPASRTLTSGASFGSGGGGANLFNPEGAAFAAGGQAMPALDRKILDAPASTTVTAVDARKVIYTGTFAMLVADVTRAVEATRKMAEQMGGYMERMTGTHIVVRVPATRFSEATAALAALGTITEKEIKAQDVTEEHTDLEIRLKSAKALLEKLLALLGKAQTVKEALEVEREIARVRTEIEQLEGKMNRLSNQVAFATLGVEFAAMKDAPSEVQATLPFAWLDLLGLENLLDIIGW